MSRVRLAAAAVAALVVVAAGAAEGVDPVITSGDPAPFPVGAQNEIAIAIDLNPKGGSPPLLAAGANDYAEQANLCEKGNCAFAPQLGISGVYFSLNGSVTEWPKTPYGTLPGYKKLGYATRGDPTLAFGPQKTPAGFAWTPKSRLYYGTMASRFDGRARVIAVSATGDARAAATSAGAWGKPVVVSPAKGFADKPAVWVDNASSSKNFGNVYACWTWERSAGDEVAAGTKPSGSRNPIYFRMSRDGGVHWGATAFLLRKIESRGRQGCAIRTDSAGAVYVVWEEYATKGSMHLLARASADAVYAAGSGRVKFEPIRRVAEVVDVGRLDSKQQRFTFDGTAGARTNSWPSLSIANGAPSGEDAPNTIVVGWSDARRAGGKVAGPEEARVAWAIGGNVPLSFMPPVNVAAAGDRPALVAVAIAPNGERLYVVYTSFDQPWENVPSGSLPTARLMHGVFRQIPFGVTGPATVSLWKTVAKSPPGDARASSNRDLTAEFIGDYNSAVATNQIGYGAWTDARNARDCKALSALRVAKSRARRLILPESCSSTQPPYFGDTNGYAATSG